MPSTSKYLAYRVTNAAKLGKARTSIVLLLLLLAMNSTLGSATSSSSSDSATYDDFLRTETGIIDSLRDYIAQSEEKISLIKRKTLEIKSKHTEALGDVDQYVGNPLNALTILKRFATDWNALQSIADKLLSSTNDYLLERRNAMTESLKFPSEDDFDEAVGSLLRLQNIYDLEPRRLSLGEMNGIKFGPQMSWSDCLEIGRKSSKSGEFRNAKYWIETAMERLPSVELPETNSSNNNETDFSAVDGRDTKNGELLRARFEILEEMLNAEYHTGNLEKSLEIAKELLLLRPKHKGILKARTSIEKKQKKESTRARSKRLMKTQKSVRQKKEMKKSAEAALIEELCRSSTIFHYSASLVPSLHTCRLERANLLLEPIKIEILSTDPYVVILHEVLTAKQIDELKSMIDELPRDNGGGDDDDDDDGGGEEGDSVVHVEFTKLAQRKLLRFNEKLQRSTGHSSHLFGEWQPQMRSFGHGKALADIDTTAAVPMEKQRRISAKALLFLQAAKVGGSIVFPQLELSSHVPSGALIYWSNLNEFQEVDYRTTHHICPVIAGKQIVAATSIRRL